MLFRFVPYVLLLVMAISISACSNRGSTGALADETTLADLPPTPMPIPTFTPAPAPAPVSESTEQAADESSLATDRVSDKVSEEVSEEITGERASENPGSETDQESNEDSEGNSVPALRDESQNADALAASASDNASDEASDDAGESGLSIILVPTATPPPASQASTARIIAEGANIRSGPGIPYDLVGVAAQGDTFGIVGKNSAGDWWQICCLDGASDSANATGWIFGPLVEVENAETVAVAADIPPLPTPDPVVVAETEPVALPVEPQPPVTDEPTLPPEVAAAEPEPAAAPPGQPAPSDGTAGNFDPNAQYQIVHFRTLGFEDNNGGIFNKGGQQLIFLSVLDEAGNGIDGVVVKNAVADNLTVVTGSKGPGKAEIKMDWDPYKLFVAQDGSGPVTSQVSNQMNNPYPHIPDIVGMLGPVDNEYAICPTVDDRCSPPFYHAHWSYEITFQKVR